MFPNKIFNSKVNNQPQKIQRTLTDINLLTDLLESLSKDDDNGNENATTIGLMSKNNNTARFARAFHMLVHFCPVLCKTTT